MPVVTTFYAAVPKPVQNVANNQRVAAATANACQTNGSQQAAGSSVALHGKGKGYFSNLFSSSLPTSGSTNSSGSILGGHFSSLTHQVLSNIRQHQSGNQGQSQSGQPSVPANAVCPPVASPTPAAASTPANNDLSTTVSLGVLDQNRAKWNQAASSGNYSFSLVTRDANANFGSGRPVNVTVSNGQVSSAGYSDNSAVGSDVRSGLKTIDQLFDSIRAAQASGQRTDVLYDSQSGFPSFVFMGNDRSTTADDTSYIISNMKLNG